MNEDKLTKNRIDKRVFIIHGWEGHPENGWKPWLKKELERENFSVNVPAMPDTNNPKMGNWIDHLSKIVGMPDKDCYFVGHSLGCIAILRYFESINDIIGGSVLVAGFSDNLGYKELNSFFTEPIIWNNIRSKCKETIAIHSDDDPYVPLKYADIFEKKLGAKIIIEHNMKHFSGDDGITELPIVLQSILEISDKG